MDLSIVVFDLRDAIEELREERAELLKRIEALEDLADKPKHGGAANRPSNEFAQAEFPASRGLVCCVQTGEPYCNAEQPRDEGNFSEQARINPHCGRHPRLEELEAHSRLISQSGEGGDDEDDGGRRSDQKN